MSLTRDLWFGACVLIDWLKGFFDREKPVIPVKEVLSTALTEEEKVIQKFLDHRVSLTYCTVDYFTVEKEHDKWRNITVLSKGGHEIASIVHLRKSRKNIVNLRTNHKSYDLNSVQDYRKLPDEHKAVVYLIAKAAKKQYDETDAALLKEKAEKQVLLDALRDKYLGEVGRNHD